MSQGAKSGRFDQKQKKGKTHHIKEMKFFHSYTHKKTRLSSIGSDFRAQNRETMTNSTHSFLSLHTLHIFTSHSSNPISGHFPKKLMFCFDCFLQLFHSVPKNSTPFFLYVLKSSFQFYLLHQIFCRPRLLPDRGL